MTKIGRCIHTHLWPKNGPERPSLALKWQNMRVVEGELTFDRCLASSFSLDYSMARQRRD